MKKQELKNELQKVHSEFAGYVLELNDTDFCFAYPAKWSAGQHLQHIVLSVGTLNRAIGNTDFMRPIAEMEPQRLPFSIDELSEVYRSVIKKGTQAPARFVPEVVQTGEKQQIEDALHKVLAALCSHIDEYTEPQLDEFTLPHPFIGRLSLREMLYFTIYHAQHHFLLARQNLEAL